MSTELQLQLLLILKDVLNLKITSMTQDDLHQGLEHMTKARSTNCKQVTLPHKLSFTWQKNLANGLIRISRDQ